MIQGFTDMYANLSEESIEKFGAIFSLQTFPKKTVIAKKGEVQQNFYILKEGIARSVIIDKNGNEYTRSIFGENSVVCSIPSLINKTPSDASYECLTACSMIKANYKDFVRLTKKHHDISIMMNRIFEEAYTRIENRLTNLAVLDATDRYLEMKKLAPNIEKQLPQYQIASYLNISAVQLSRIRKKLSLL